MSILKQAHEALLQARLALAAMEQRTPLVRHHNDQIYRDMSAASTALALAIHEQDKDLDAVLHGARVTAYQIGKLRVVERKKDGVPAMWAVLNEHGEYLGRNSGQFCFEPHPSVLTYEWTQAHHWNTAKEALQAAFNNSTPSQHGQ